MKGLVERPLSLSLAELKAMPATEAVAVACDGEPGEIQPMEPRWNPAGYVRDVVETVDVVAG